MQTLLTALALLLSSFFPAPQAPASGLFSVDYNPGPVIQQDCKASRATIYTNATGHDVTLTGIDMWMGLYRNSYADITLKLYRISDGNTLGGFQMDRYANPTGPIQRFVSFEPDGFVLADGDGIWLDGLNCYVSGSPSPMHPQVTLYFHN